MFTNSLVYSWEQIVYSTVRRSIFWNNIMSECMILWPLSNLEINAPFEEIFVSMQGGFVDLQIECLIDLFKQKVSCCSYLISCLLYPDNSKMWHKTTCRQEPLKDLETHQRKLSLDNNTTRSNISKTGECLAGGENTARWFWHGQGNVTIHNNTSKTATVGRESRMVWISRRVSLLCMGQNHGKSIKDFMEGKWNWYLLNTDYKSYTRLISLVIKLRFALYQTHPQECLTLQNTWRLLQDQQG